MDRPPAPGEDPSLHPARVLVEEHLTLASSAWSAGPAGARARFVRDPDDRVSRGPASVVTDRGGVRIVLPDDAVAIAYETPSLLDPIRWHHSVAFCVPDPVAARAGHTVVTELGPDDAALRPADLGGTLFDLGVGGAAAEVLVRTADPDALRLLRAAAGAPLRPGLLAELRGHRPHAVVRTVAARIEVHAPRPGAALRLRPGPARAGSALPIPDGLTPVLRLHPAHPAVAHDGRPTPYDADRDAALLALLDRHGDPVLGVLAADVADAVRTMRGPDAVAAQRDAPGRAVVAVTLRRLAFTIGTSGTLTAWRGRYGPDPALADPGEE